jgi:arylsulfatase A-like enzyme
METSMSEKPNILFIMTDQQRFDTIAALGNDIIYTPNMDRLVRRGVTFENGYSTCPVCVPARYTVRTGCEPPTTRVFTNGRSRPVEGQADTMEGRCGAYLPKVMRERGYRTFGIGKFHTQPWDEDLGYDVHLHSEELYGPGQREQDSYAAWIAKEHPALDYVEGLMGERTEMYYMPQVSAQPAEATVEGWAADRAVEQIQADDSKPYFGFVSFVGPHPPFAPPIPFNRLYHPDKMPNPVRGELATDHMDEQIPWMNRIIWADELNDFSARLAKSRYYGELTYIDDCLGRILDAVEARPDGDNTVICFYADHGDHLGDHSAWQKESYFEQACHVPYLVSWPAQIPADVRRDEIVCLTDLFGIATSASGETLTRDGIDVLGLLAGEAPARETLFGYFGEPGTLMFKIMAREPGWKYIFISNGDREQLFDLTNDPNELKNLASERTDLARAMRQKAIQACTDHPGAADAVENGAFKTFAYAKITGPDRIYQFDRSRGVTGFPDTPEEGIRAWREREGL